MKSDFKATGQPILVTGAHRSGTTWVGNMIAQSKKVCYIKEPFSIHHRPGICSAKFDLHFTNVNQENEKEYITHIEDSLNLKFHLLQDIKTIRRINHIKKLIKNYYTFEIGKIRNARPLFKDPIAVFSSDWLFNKFNFQIVVLVRHPAAFASSLKRLGLFHPFSHFMQQQKLMDEFPINFRKKIEEYTAIQVKYGSIKYPDQIDQIILLWNLIYSYVHTKASQYPEWLVIKHEDISLNPQKYFTKIFKYLSVDIDDRILSKILGYSDSNNPVEIKADEWHQLKRNSKENIFNWKKRLTKAEIERIYSGTYETSSLYYNDDSWNK